MSARNYTRGPSRPGAKRGDLSGGAKIVTSGVLMRLPMSESARRWRDKKGLRREIARREFEKARENLRAKGIEVANPERETKSLE